MIRHVAAGVCLLAVSQLCYAQELTPQQIEDWFNGTQEKKIAAVNEGNLVFLSRAPDKPVHHHHNTVIITDQTVRDGWAQLVQCHQNLDQVSQAQIMFKADRIRDLSIENYSGIEKAWVEGASVQLANIGPNARICIKARSHALAANGDGTYKLTNGPFMRRFLDGYYPMHVSMDIVLQSHKIALEGILPLQQEGFTVKQTPGAIHLDAWFEGRLKTELKFRKIARAPALTSPR